MNHAEMLNAQLTHDNRAEPEHIELPGEEDLAAWAAELTITAESALALIGRAERALAEWDLDAARDLLASAAAEMRGAQA